MAYRPDVRVRIVPVGINYFQVCACAHAAVPLPMHMAGAACRVCAPSNTRCCRRCSWSPMHACPQGHRFRSRAFVEFGDPMDIPSELVKEYRAGLPRTGSGRLMPRRTPQAKSARRFHPLRSLLTGIYLRHTSYGHEILRMETPGQAGRREHL
jgi:hypothetical protein